MREHRPGTTRFLAVLAATCTAGSLAVLAATAATSDAGTSTASVEGPPQHLTVAGAPDDTVVLPSMVVRPAVDSVIDDIVGREQAGKDCATDPPSTEPATDLCKTKEAFDQDASSGRTLDLGSTIAGGDIGEAAVLGPVEDRVKQLANTYSIGAGDMFPTSGGTATFPDAVGKALTTAGVHGVQVTEAGSEPTSTTAPPTTTSPTTTTPTSVTPTSGAAPTSGHDPRTSTTAGSPAGSTTTSAAAPPPAGSGPDESAAALPPAPPSDTGRPPAKSAAGGSDAKPDFSLLPTGDLLAKLHALIPVGEAVPSVGPSTTEHHARQDDQRRVELRTAGSARAISGDQQTSDVQLAAVLAALLGLTLAAGALARAWVVRRSR